MLEKKSAFFSLGVLLYIHVSTFDLQDDVSHVISFVFKLFVVSNNSITRSQECLRSICESTTFVITDRESLEAMVRNSATPKSMPILRTINRSSSTFCRHVRRLEIALGSDFVTDRDNLDQALPKLGKPLDTLNLHSLRLDCFGNLQQLNIWVSARPSRKPIHGRLGPGITEIRADSLKRALDSFKAIKRVTISSPLHSSIEPDEGFVEGLALPGHQFWKRSVGDRAHPVMGYSMPGKKWDSLIFTSNVRKTIG